MCVNPITIKNQGFKRLGGMPYIDVPCGQCFECASVKSDDLFVRAWSLWRSLDKTKWSAHFVTLTFSEENIPRHIMYRCPSTFKGDINKMSDFERFREIHSDGLKEFEPKEVRTFDHTLLRRFLKSYRQYYRRKFSKWHMEVDRKWIEPLYDSFGTLKRRGYFRKVYHRVYDYIEKERLPHFLVTCEYGEKFHRPHYHAIVFLPRICSFKDAQKEILKFWHYGFVYDVHLVEKDGLTLERNIEQSFKYVVKYAAKGSSWLPPYVKSKRFYFTDIERCDILPRVFTTNGFGAQLEGVLKEDNYELGSITFSVDGKPKSFNLPRYILRRHYTEVERVKDGTIESVSLYRLINGISKTSPYYRSKVLYRNDYESFRRAHLVKSLRRQYSDFMTSCPRYKSLGVSMSDYVDFVLSRYNRHFDLYPKCDIPFKRVLSIIKEEGDFVSSFEENFVSLWPKVQPLIFENYDSVSFCRKSWNASLLFNLIRVYGRIRRIKRCRDKEAAKVTEARFFRDHLIKKRV